MNQQINKSTRHEKKEGNTRSLKDYNSITSHKDTAIIVTLNKELKSDDKMYQWLQRRNKQVGEWSKKIRSKPGQKKTQKWKRVEQC